MRRGSALKTSVFAMLAAVSAIGMTPALAHEDTPSPFAFNEAALSYNDQFIAVKAPIVALTDVRVIDGTGAKPRERQTLILQDGKILAQGRTGSVKIPTDAKVVSLAGRTVMPGWVMHHQHLYYHSAAPTPAISALATPSMITYPRLYLASGITTARTVGTYHPNDDLKLKEGIEKGIFLGPDFDLTAPFIQGKADYFQLIRSQRDPQDVKETVKFWSDQGFTSFKMYIHISKDEARAAIDEAHRLGKKITGHLCSLSYGEMLDLGIDEFEHGFQAIYVDMMPNRLPPTQCPYPQILGETVKIDVNSPQVQRLFKRIIDKRVIVDSTLGGLARLMRDTLLPPISEETMSYYTAERRAQFKDEIARRDAMVDMTPYLTKLMELDYAFWKAGGTLVTGGDSVGLTGAVPGRTDLESLELLHRAGIPALEVIKIATHNGAQGLGMTDRGVIAPGKRADLIVVNGDPVKDFNAIYNVETVFKAGVGYDSKKLKDSVRGTIGMIN